LPVINQLHIILISLFIKTYIGAFVKRTLKSLMTVTILTGSLTASALPIDWNGTLGFDQNIIKNARRSSDTCDSTLSGTQCLTDDNQNARFQSMFLKLQPTIIINDSTSIKGELSTGTSRGGFLGDNIEGTSTDSYFGQTTSGSTLNINQFYAELYADTALFKVGKFSKHYGLGAVMSSGDGAWDRFFSAYDGMEAEFKLGSFKLTTLLAKLNNSVTTGANANVRNGNYDTNETSITAMYDNSNKNLKAGIYYGQREVETGSELYGANTGPQSVTIIDVFFDKSWGNFNLAMEITMVSGNVGTTYGSTTKQDFDANAFIIETSYQINPRWKVGLNAGSVSGSDGDQGSQEALYLHPNYKIAEIMFNYNLAGFQDANENIFNASVVNTNYARLFAHYSNDAWSWRFDLIMATANEVAKSGASFYDHDKAAYVTNAGADQDSNLGMEFDAAFDYEWSPSIVVTGYVAHYQVGDYYAFTNTTTPLSLGDVTATGFKLNIGF
jgi:hypothetical protein